MKVVVVVAAENVRKLVAFGPDYCSYIEEYKQVAQKIFALELIDQQNELGGCIHLKKMFYLLTPPEFFVTKLTVEPHQGV